MMEMLFEYFLSFIDYTTLLYFYLQLIDKKVEWRNFWVSVIMISLLQLGKDTMLDFGGFSVFIDVFFITGFLFLYGKPYTTLRFLNALMLNSIFKFTIIFFVSLAIELSIDIQSTLVFGMNRFIFSAILKCFTLLVLMYSIKPFKKLCNIMATEMVKVMAIIVATSMFALSYVYGNSADDENALIYTFFLTIIIVFVYYLLYRYCVITKESANYQLMNNMMNMTMDHIKEVEKEHQQIKKMRHDTKNQLLILCGLLEEKKYKEMEQILYPMVQELDTHKVTISGNTYVDTILRQKMAQYPAIEFKLHISVPQNVNIEGRDLIPLLTNIIDNACEELQRIHEHTFSLTIKSNDTQLSIVESNHCRKKINLRTDKDPKLHGLGLKIIHDIVKKYNGDLQIQTEEDFILKILIFI